MAAELWVNDGGVARQIREVWVNDSGVARRIQEIWVNDSGTARRIFASDLISIADNTASSVTVNPIVSTAQYRLANDGDIDGTAGSNVVADLGDWITPQINMANFECRATMVSGSLTSGTTGTWLNLGTTRTWTKSSSSGPDSCSFTLEIRRASDSVVMDTATITLSANSAF